MIPDRSTIWEFKNRLVDTGMIDDLWTGLQQQLDARGLKIHRGVIQDATFIYADPGHATADTTRGNQARTRRSRDGTWAEEREKRVSSGIHFTPSSTRSGIRSAE